MKLAEIIKKAARGEELNALEKAELERFDPDALSTRADTAEAKLKEAQEKLDAAEQEKLTEAELPKRNSKPPMRPAAPPKPSATMRKRSTPH